MIDKTQRSRKRLVRRPAYVVVGRLKMKGIRNILLQRKQDKDYTFNRVILILLGLVMQPAPSTYIRRDGAPQKEQVGQV